jgi:hypothetical protein
MREKLNENPAAQVVLIGVLVLVVGFFLLHGGFLGGGGSESSESGEAATTTEASAAEGVVSSEPTAATTAVELPQDAKLPHAVEAAYKRGETIVLLVYRPGGIDDKLTKEAAEIAAETPGVAYFQTTVDHVARYSKITGPLGVSSAPALIAISDKKLAAGGAAPATVTYGFQTAEDVRQAIVDARYHGPELSYAPN